MIRTVIGRISANALFSRNQGPLFHPLVRRAPIIRNQPITPCFIASRKFSNVRDEDSEHRPTPNKSSKKVPNWRKRNTNFDSERQKNAKMQDMEETTAYHTAENYDMAALYNHVSVKSAGTTMTDEDDGSAVISRRFKGGDVYYFQGGSVVMWGSSQSDATDVSKELKQFEKEPIESIQSESMDYTMHHNDSFIREDIIHLRSDLEEQEYKRHQSAFSFGLHQSVKLASIEEKIVGQIRGTMNIQEHSVNKRGWLSDHRTAKSVNQMSSDSLSIRASSNSHSESIGTPDIFWEHPQSERFFIQITKNLEIGSRMDIVNKRLDEILVMLKMLKSESATDHSVRLEVLIILLIAAEIVIHITPSLLDSSEGDEEESEKDKKLH